MKLEDFEPIFGEPKVEWGAQGSLSLRRFLFHVHASDPSHLRIHVTDFHSNTWEAIRSVLQLEDMRDNIGIGGSWPEFVGYVTSSLKSDVKLSMEGHSNTDGAAYAKLVAQKSKGLPLISISLNKLTDSAASEAIANLSLGLFSAFKIMQSSLVEEQKRSCQLTKIISAEKERNESIQNQLEQYSKKHKLQKLSGSYKGDVSDPLTYTLQSSPDKPAALDTGSTKVINRVIPAFRRAKVRGVLLQDTEDDNNV